MEGTGRPKSRFSFQQKGTYGAVAPPRAGVAPVQGYGAAQQMVQRTIATAPVQPQVPSKPARDYFDDDDDDTGGYSAYNSAAGSQRKEAADDDYDPLDDFMAGIQEQVTKQAAKPSVQQALPEIVSGLDGAGSDYDSEEDYRASGGGNTAAGGDSDDDNDTGAGPPKKTRIEPLPKVDHGSVVYAPFQKKFYTEHADITSMSVQEVAAYRDELDVHVTPYTSPRPVRSFLQLGLHSALLAAITSAGYEQPTAIQAQTIPVVLSGSDVIALAKTGSGKTLAYLWPMITHILAQPQMQRGDGPIGLVLAPTRELAAQIHSEAKKFATKVYNIRVVAVYGGGGKWEMSKALKDEAPELVIATPGRFIEMVRNKSTNLRRCTMVVLDEADRMFEMGFEYQMLSIVQNIRRDRQVLMFSATMKRKIESFAREILRNEVKIVVGKPGQANADIQQTAQIFTHETEKLHWLRSNIDAFAADGKVLIFVLSKAGTEEITAELKSLFTRRQLEIGVDCLHGDKDQALRSRIMQQFSRPSDRPDALTVLVATDIASRGLDVKDIRTVINYDIAKNIETYVHRIGRTGRMGVEGVTPGTAYTLLTPKESSFAVDLVQNLNLSRQPVSPALLQLAQADAKWNRVKHIPVGGGGGGGGSVGGGGGAGRGGLGFGAAGVHQGRASVALTSSMLANSAFRGSKPAGSSSAGGAGYPAAVPPAAPAAAMSELPAGMRGTFQRASAGTGLGSTAVPTSLPPPPPPAAFGAPAGMRAAPPNNDFAANPYVAGHSQGRGKHLTQPSWMVSGGAGGAAGTAAAVGASATVNAAQFGAPSAEAMSRQFADREALTGGLVGLAAGGVKRPSRFDRADSAPPPVLTVPATTSTTGEGEAEGEGKSVSAAVRVDASAEATRAPPTKRSRWDT